MLTAIIEKALVSKDFSVVHVRVDWQLGWLAKLGYCSLVCTWLCGFGYIQTGRESQRGVSSQLSLQNSQRHICLVLLDLFKRFITIFYLIVARCNSTLLPSKIRPGFYIGLMNSTSYPSVSKQMACTTFSVSMFRLFGHYKVIEKLSWMFLSKSSIYEQRQHN